MQTSADNSFLGNTIPLWGELPSTLASMLLFPTCCPNSALLCRYWIQVVKTEFCLLSASQGQPSDFLGSQA